ncbi:hypothetical protein HZS_39 [Henneguya salminicola]|nr:hypothetical protein HZS_39 [Henneguya salminicola]
MNKSLLYFVISVIFMPSLSIPVVEDIIAPCGSSHTIRILEDPSSWISSVWRFEDNKSRSFSLLTWEAQLGHYLHKHNVYRESVFILDYGVHYLSLYQMSIILNNTMITFTSYSQKNDNKEILFNISHQE